MGYHLNRLDEPIFMAVSKPMQTEFGIHHRLESCVSSLFAIMMPRRDFEFQTHKSEPFVVKNTQKIGFLAIKNIQAPPNCVFFQ